MLGGHGHFRRIWANTRFVRIRRTRRQLPDRPYGPLFTVTAIIAFGIVFGLVLVLVLS